MSVSLIDILSNATGGKCLIALDSGKKEENGRNVSIMLAHSYTVTLIYNLLKAPASVFMQVPTNPAGMKSFYHFKSTNRYKLHLMFP
jgi:hypothetical protein